MTLKDLVKFAEALAKEHPDFDPKLLEQWIHDNIPANRIGQLVTDLTATSAQASAQLPTFTPLSPEDLSLCELGERIQYHLSVISEYKTWKREQSSSVSAVSSSTASLSSSLSQSSTDSLPQSSASKNLSPQSSIGSSPSVPALPTPATVSAYSHPHDYVMASLWRLRTEQSRRDTAKHPLAWLDKFSEVDLPVTLIADVIYAALALLNIDTSRLDETPPSFEFVSSTVPAAPERVRHLLDLNQVLGLLTLPRRIVPPLPAEQGPSEPDVDYEFVWIRTLTALDAALDALAKIQTGHSAVASIQVKTAKTDIPFNALLQSVVGTTTAMRTSISQHYRSPQ